MESNSSSFLLGIDYDFNQVIGTPNLTGSPERRLLLAIIERAILDYVGNEPKEVQAAEEWLFGESDNSLQEQFSFPWICEQLDLDIYKISEKIRAMPRRGNRRVAPWYFMKSMAGA